MDKVSVVGLFCEDIREETQDKFSLVGVFPDNVNVNQIPAAFPKLGIFARINIDPDFEVKDIVFDLQLPDGEVVRLHQYDVAALKTEQQKSKNLGAPYTGLLLKAMASPAPIPRAGRMYAFVTVNGEKIIAAHLNIQLEPKDKKQTA